MNILEIIRKKMAGEKTEVMRTLEATPIFSGLNDLELKKIEVITHEREYSPEETVFHENEPGAGLYIIRTGEIKLTKKGTTGTEVLIATMKDGEFFGELALLDEAPRSANAVSTAKTQILGFYRPDFLSLLQREPKLGSKVLLNLSLILAKRLRTTTATSVRGASSHAS
jgi:CRP/FNR family transcriptional regulator, cyclic AMP receptor protein